MSEEIRKPGKKINESALEGVSGGYDRGDIGYAEVICLNCKLTNPDACVGGSPELLADLLDHVDGWANCPYCIGPMG